jgi:hypothetical protein
LAKHSEWLLAVNRDEPDLTLGEICSRLEDKGVVVAPSISFKKTNDTRLH